MRVLREASIPDCCIVLDSFLPIFFYDFTTVKHDKTQLLNSTVVIVIRLKIRAKMIKANSNAASH